MYEKSRYWRCGYIYLAAVIFFIVPIPSLLLDVMLAINIAIALDYSV